MNVGKPGGLTGLCADCRHAETITSTKGSTFTLCRMHARDSRYPKYPRLPVLVCEGYDRVTKAPDSHPHATPT